MYDKLAIDLVAASETQDNVQCGVVHDSVVLERSLIFQLFAAPEQSVGYKEMNLVEIILNLKFIDSV